MRVIVFAALLGLAQGPGIAQEEVSLGTGGVLRGLDKVDGDVIDLSLAAGETGEVGYLSVTLRECRYPKGTVAEAFAYLSIRDTQDEKVVFDGWMIASSPALNALEHPRYDVWVLRCKTE